MTARHNGTRTGSRALVLVLASLVLLCLPSTPGRSLSPGKDTGRGRKGAPAAIDLRVLNSLAVAPWIVADRAEEILSVEGICPEVEIACLRVRRHKLEAQLGTFGTDDEKVKLRLDPVLKRLSALEGVRRVKDRALDYITRVPTEIVIHNEQFAELFVEAIEEKARDGHLTWEEARPLVPLLFLADDRYGLATLTGHIGEPGTEGEGTPRRALKFTLAVGILQALGDTQDTRVVGAIAQYLPPQCPGPAADALGWMIGETPLTICEDGLPTRETWERLLHAVEGRLVWQGTHIKTGDPAAQSSVNIAVHYGSFYRISWAAIYLDKYVLPANGAFRDPLTPDESKRLRDFRRLSDKEQERLGKAALRARLVGGPGTSTRPGPTTLPTGSAPSTSAAPAWATTTPAR